jgi:hypothetical protein
MRLDGVKGSRRWLLRASNIRFLFVTARCNPASRTNTRVGYLVEPSKIGRRRIIGERQAWVVVGAAAVLLAAAVIAAALLATRAARVDVIQALRAD